MCRPVGAKQEAWIDGKRNLSRTSEDSLHCVYIPVRRVRHWQSYRGSDQHLLPGQQDDGVVHQLQQQRDKPETGKNQISGAAQPKAVAVSLADRGVALGWRSSRLLNLGAALNGRGKQKLTQTLKCGKTAARN